MITLSIQRYCFFFYYDRSLIAHCMLDDVSCLVILALEPYWRDTLQLKKHCNNYDMRKTIKAAELKRAFNEIPDDHDVCFGPVLGNHVGSLTFFRTKWVAEKLVNVQFNEEFEVTSDHWEELQKPRPNI